MAAAVNLFATRGYAETAISEIAAAAGISERSFFRYFASLALPHRNERTS